jgi:hypothetical protein
LSPACSGNCPPGASGPARGAEAPGSPSSSVSPG